MSGLPAAPGFDWPSLEAVLAVLFLQAGYNTTIVMAGTTLLGIAAGIVGTFAVLRKRALMGDTLAHATLPGIALAFILAVAVGGDGRSLPLLLAGAAATGIVGVLVVQGIARHTRIPEDAAMGAVLSVFFGAGFVLLSYIQTLGTGSEGGLGHLIYGQTATMSQRDAVAIGLVAGAAALATLLLYKEFRLACFDRDFAAAQGWPVSLIDLLMMALVVLVTVIGLQAVGLIMVVALIIIPAAAARFWTERLGVMTLTAALIGGASGYLGAGLSALFPRFPAGSVIVLMAGLFFILSLFLAPARGLLADARRRAGLRLRIAAQHVLRATYEAVEGGRAIDGVAVPRSEIAARRGWAPGLLALVLARLRFQGLVTVDGELLRLTPQGRTEALRVTRNHRLWEQFLLSQAHLAPSHVDRSADLLEHVLPPELLTRLERELAAAGRLPRVPGVPPSPHDLDDALIPATR